MIKTIGALSVAFAVGAAAVKAQPPNSSHVSSQNRNAMSTVTSRDGVKIAFERTGSGPALLLIGGALSDRNGGKPLANILSEHFSVYVVDRRGRGDSTDAKTYAVDREIEDIDALIDHAGGSAFLYGVSSGAALSLQAAAKLGPSKVTKLALYEPPYSARSDKEKQEFSAQKKRVNELIKAGPPGEAASYFLTAIGTPPEALAKLKGSPQWDSMRKMDFTLDYDYAVLGDGTLPSTVAKSISVPTLIIDGDKTMDFMHATADDLARLIRGAQRKTLAGQTHQASPEVVAPVLTDFLTRSEN